MLKPWSAYASLKVPEKLNISVDTDISQAHSDWLTAESTPRLVSLKTLHNMRHQGKGLLLMPAYAQTRYVYDSGNIIAVDAAQYQNTPAIDHVNQFDQLGPCYREDLDDILVEYRLGCIISDAAAYAAEHSTIQSNSGDKKPVALMVIDALRTVDTGYLLAASNPKAVADKLLAAPGSSAHNKGMAVDLTLVYWNDQAQCWADADMLGHMDHPDMLTNHRNYQKLSGVQQHNRLELERVMLRAALQNNMLIAPLREEFWDFRFPENGLDLWRVLESIARVIQCESAFQECSERIENIRALLKSGNKQQAYAEFYLTKKAFVQHWKRLFSDQAAQDNLNELLGVTEDSFEMLQLIYHGNVNVIYDADLPAPMQQAHPLLKYLLDIGVE